MLKHIMGGLTVCLATLGIGNLPAVRPHLDNGKLRLAALLDQTSLALEGTTRERRLLVSGIEPVSDFPEGTAPRQIGRSVGMLWIDITDDKGKTRTQNCTATLIAPTLLITNHHCLGKDKPGDRMALELWIDYRGGKPNRYEVEPAPVEVDAELDFALLRLTPPAPSLQAAALTSLRFRIAQPGERLLLLHHGGGKPLQVTRAHCRVAPSSPGDQDLRHTCATLPGSSGALVLAERDHAVVGLHRARRRGEELSPGVATPVAALLAKSATLRRLVPAGLVQAAAR